MIVAEQIIVALKAALTGLATTGSNVFREPQYAAKTWPRIVIREPDGDASSERVVEFPAPCLLECIQRLELTIIVKAATGDTAQARSQIRGEIEAVLAANPTLGGLCHECRPSAHPWRTGESTEGDQPVAIGVLTIESLFYVREDARDVPL